MKVAITLRVMRLPARSRLHQQVVTERSCLRQQVVTEVCPADKTSARQRKRHEKGGILTDSAFKFSKGPGQAGEGLPAFATAAVALAAAIAIPALAAATTATTAAAAVAATATAAATTAAAATVAATATAAAATTAVAATACAAAATTEGRAFFLRTSFIDRQGATAEIFAVQARDGSRHGFRCVHANEGKPTWTAALTVHRQEDIGNAAELGEQIAQIDIGGTEGEIPHIHFRVHFGILSGH